MAEMQVTYFASGSSAVLDIRGFSRVLHPIGVSIPELSEPAIDELLGLAGLPIQVFVDTSAFSEMKFGPDGPVVVAEIDDAGWRLRMDVHRRIAVALRGQAYLVAPDRVGDQAVTLARLAEHAPALRELHGLGARIVVPIQRGAMTPVEFDAAVVRTIGFSSFIRGIPGNKAAMPTAELEDYVRAVRPRAVHFLGVGPKNPRFNALVNVFRRMVHGAELSCDSNLLAANVGLSNGRGGAMRRLTAVQHPNVPGSGIQRYGADGQPNNEPVTRDDAIVLALGPALFFERAMRAYRDAGLIGTREPELQLGLFDEARSP